MIRTVIAEDEGPLLRGIAAMIKRADPAFEPVCLAKNGKEALEYLSQHEADVVFTDINMPVMGGIQLMKELRAVNAAIPIVVISGYDEFEYARQALRYGALNYLLKPIARDELQTLLEEIKDICGKNEHAQKREAFIEALFGGREEAPAAFELKTLSLFYLCSGAFRYENSGDDERMPGALSDREMRRILADYWPEENFWLFYGNKANEALWLLEGEAAGQEAIIRRAAERRFGEAVMLTCVVCQDPAPAALAASVREAAETLRYSVSPGRSRFVRERPPFRQPAKDLAAENALKIALHRGELPMAFEIIEKRWRSLPSAVRTQAAMERYLLSLAEFIKEDFGTEGEEKAETLRRIREFFVPAESEKAVIRSFLAYCQSLREEETERVPDNEDIMQALDLYIQEHLSENLSLKALGSRFGLVPPYLSKLFKAYKGLTPTQYIRQLRMETAKRLLAERPELLVKDIAASIGYENPLYFSRTFNEHVGLYPSDYRDQYRKD